MTYNGWTNRETWAVNLWLANDEGLYAGARDMARHATDEYQLAYSLRDWLVEISPELEASLWSDLLTSAIAAVDWNEIARHWFEDEREDDES